MNQLIDFNYSQEFKFINFIMIQILIKNKILVCGLIKIEIFGKCKLIKR